MAGTGEDGTLTDAEINRLESEGWDEDSIDCYKRFQKRLALLYPMLMVENGIQTPKGQGTLHRVIEGEALVLLTRGRATENYRNGKPYVPLSAFNPNDLRPATRMEAAG